MVTDLPQALTELPMNRHVSLWPSLLLTHSQSRWQLKAVRGGEWTIFCNANLESWNFILEPLGCFCEILQLWKFPLHSICESRRITCTEWHHVCVDCQYRGAEATQWLQWRPERKPCLQDGTVTVDADKYRLVGISLSGCEPPDVRLPRIR